MLVSKTENDLVNQCNFSLHTGTYDSEQTCNELCWK